MPTSPSQDPDQQSSSNGSRLDRKYRHSLPHQPVELPPSVLRHTQSHRYDSQNKKKKKTAYAAQIPSIMESENSDDELEKGVALKVDATRGSVVYENEKRGTKTTKVKAKDSISKAGLAYDNTAFEGNVTAKRNSAATSSRAPSVQSLEIVREQYCCCAKRTKCERTLLTIVIILTIIIIVLIVVIIVIASQEDIRNIGNRFNL